MSSGKPTIAFFGATGGSGSTALTHALKGQHHCTARMSDPSHSVFLHPLTIPVVRSPLKLRQILLTEHSVCAETIDEYLIIHQGDARNYEDVMGVQDPFVVHTVINIPRFLKLSSPLLPQLISSPQYGPLSVSIPSFSSRCALLYLSQPTQPRSRKTPCALSSLPSVS